MCIIEFPSHMPHDLTEGPLRNKVSVALSDKMLGAVLEIGEEEHRNKNNTVVLLLEAGIIALRLYGVQLSQLRSSIEGGTE